MEDLARRVLEGTDDAVVVADTEGVIRFWNRSAERVFGWPAEEAVGRTLDLIVPEKHRATHWAGYRRVMAGGETAYAGRLLAVPALRRDGERISIEFSVAILRGTGVAAIIRDVTERRRAEQELRRRLDARERRPA
jgi:PAS domain S-box-containing protein